MLIFVSSVFGIIFVISLLIIVYSANDLFQQLGEFKNNPPQKVFMTEYQRIKEERHAKEKTSKKV